MNKVALLAIHGMGSTQRGFSHELVQDLTRKMNNHFAELVVFKEVYYQHILQDNETEVWHKLAGKLRWDALRQFILFGFADAAGLEHRKELPNSAYLQAQLEIARSLYQVSQQLDNTDKVVVLAHSLGCQVMSCYLWDAAQAAANPENPNVAAGIWRHIQQHAQAIAGKDQLSPEDIQFLQGKRLALLVTTGCNIPIFVAAHKQSDIVPFAKPNKDFVWHNYYDKDDVLGWPLAELSPAYGELVTDIRINAGGGVLGWISKSWNPMSHGEYWEDKDLLKPLARQLETLAMTGKLPPH